MNIVTEPKLSGKPIADKPHKRPVRLVRWFLIVGLLLAAVVSGLVFFKFVFLPNLFKQIFSKPPPPTNVSIATAKSETIPNLLTAVGDLAAPPSHRRRRHLLAVRRHRHHYHSHAGGLYRVPEQHREGPHRRRREGLTFYRGEAEERRSGGLLKLMLFTLNRKSPCLRISVPPCGISVPSVPSVSVLASLVDAALDFLSTGIVWTTTWLISQQDQYKYPVGRRR